MRVKLLTEGVSDFSDNTQTTEGYREAGSSAVVIVAVHDMNMSHSARSLCELSSAVEIV